MSDQAKLYRGMLDKARSGQVGLGQVRLGQVMLGQVKLGEVERILGGFVFMQWWPVVDAVEQISCYLI